MALEPLRTVLAPEYALLAAAAAGKSPPEGLAIEWSKVVRLANWHRLGPLLARSLKTEPSVAAPSEVLAALEDDRERTTARNLCLRAELVRVAALLSENEIPVMALKGLALIETAYRDISLRPMVDVDILVPEALIEPAYRLVEGLGYAPVPQTAAGAVAMRQRSHQYPSLVRHDGLAAIDVHRHLVDLDHPLRFDLDGLWNRARPSSVGAHIVPSPEDLLIHVALHSFGSRLWRSDGALGQLGDIAWLVGEDDLDWQLVAAEIERHGLAGPMFLSLLLAREVVGAAVPVALLASIRPPSFRPALARSCIRQRVLADRPAPPAVSVTKHPKSWHERLVPRPAALARRTTAPARGLVLLGLYLRHGWTVVRLTVRSAPAPLALARGLLLNRWLHSLGRPTHRAGAALVAERRGAGPSGGTAERAERESGSDRPRS